MADHGLADWLAETVRQSVAMAEEAIAMHSQAEQAIRDAQLMGEYLVHRPVSYL